MAAEEPELAKLLATVHGLREHAAASGGMPSADLAAELHRVALAYRQKGLRAEALATAREAVEAYRGMDRTPPGDCRAELASTLDLLGTILGEAGQFEAALSPTQEALALRGELASADPEAGAPALAASQHNLGLRLGDLGRHAEAIRTNRAALAIYRTLAQSNLQEHQADLASCLNSLGGHLADLGEREEAKQATQEALAIRRRLVESQPDEFEAELADTLSNLARRHADAGHYDAAIEAAHEAVGIHQHLADRNPQTFRPILAVSLNNLATWMSAAGRHGEGLTMAARAVDIYRQLAAEEPQVFTPGLAMACGTHGDALRAMRDLRGAHHAYAEGIRLLAPYFTRGPLAHERVMKAHVARHFEVCKEMGVGVDEALLAPVANALETLDEQRRAAERADEALAAMSVNQSGNDAGAQRQPKSQFEIDGARFATLDGFFDEISRVLKPGAFWGRNLDAFSDILRGGFGTPEEGFVLRWRNAHLSRERLGRELTIRMLERRLRWSLRGRRAIKEQIALAHRGEVPTLFETLVEIIRDHGPGGDEQSDGVELILD